MQRSAGFSLLEVMCAILILGVGIVGLMEGMTGALTSSKEAEVQTAAALIAAGQIETLRADGLIVEGETEGECAELPQYEWRQAITTTSIDGLYDVRVTVEQSRTGQQIYELRTMLFDPPLVSTNRADDTLNARKRRNRGAR